MPQSLARLHVHLVCSTKNRETILHDAVSESNVGAVREHIASQQEHHRKRSFQEEYRLFLERHGVVFDERYVWD
jgi:aminoglycoside phosphotransferase family enzyme